MDSSTIGAVPGMTTMAGASQASQVIQAINIPAAHRAPAGDPMMALHDATPKPTPQL